MQRQLAAGGLISWGRTGFSSRSRQTISSFQAGARGGSLYARCFSFSEDTVGCRWWTPTENFVPNKKTPNRRGAGPGVCAEVFLSGALHQFSALPSRVRHHFAGERKPSEARCGLGAGTMRSSASPIRTRELLPPDRYFQEHPEWYTDAAHRCSFRMFKPCRTALAGSSCREEPGSHGAPPQTPSCFPGPFS